MEKAKMRHNKAQMLLGDYAAGELAIAQYQALTEHLQVCEICRKDLAEIEQIRARMRSFALPADIFAHDPAFIKGGAEFSALFDNLGPEGAAFAPGRMLGESNRRPAHRPFVLLVAALLTFCLILSTVVTFAIATYKNNSAARPHPISRPTATPRPKLLCPTITPGFIPTPTAAMVPPTPTPTAAKALPTPTPIGGNCATSTPTQDPTPTLMPTPTSKPSP